MTTRADAFRYGVLIGLREAGCTEKVAYEILDELEASKYDLVAFTTPSHVKVAGAVMPLVRGAVSTARKIIPQAAKALPKTIDAQFSVVKPGMGSKIQGAAGGAWDWLKKHPKTLAGAAAVPAFGLGHHWGYGSGNEAGQQTGRQEGYEGATQTRMQDLYAMMQMMQQQRGGVPPWYNPRAIYGG